MTSGKLLSTATFALLIALCVAVPTPYESWFAKTNVSLSLLSVVYQDGMVITSDEFGNMYTWNASTGNQEWIYFVEPSSSVSYVLRDLRSIGNGLVLFSERNTIGVLRIKDGQLVWSMAKPWITSTTNYWAEFPTIDYNATHFLALATNADYKNMVYLFEKSTGYYTNFSMPCIVSQKPVFTPDQAFLVYHCSQRLIYVHAGNLTIAYDSVMKDKTNNNVYYDTQPQFFGNYLIGSTLGGYVLVVNSTGQLEKISTSFQTKILGMYLYNDKASGAIYAALVHKMNVTIYCIDNMTIVSSYRVPTTSSNIYAMTGFGNGVFAISDDDCNMFGFDTKTEQFIYKLPFLQKGYKPIFNDSPYPGVTAFTCMSNIPGLSTSGRMMQVLDLAKGELQYERWFLNNVKAVALTPLQGKSLVVIQENGWVYSLDINGALIAGPTESQLFPLEKIATRIGVRDGVMYYATTKRLVAVRTDGKYLYNISFTSGYEPPLFYPVFAYGKVIITVGYNWLVFNPETQTLEKTISASTPCSSQPTMSPLVVDETGLYMVHSYCIARINSTLDAVAYKYNDLNNIVAPAAFTKEYIIVVDTYNRMAAIRKSNLTVAWMKVLATTSLSSPVAVTDNEFYVANKEATIFAINARNGSETVWSLGGQFGTAKTPKLFKYNNFIYMVHNGRLLSYRSQFWKQPEMQMCKYRFNVSIAQRETEFGEPTITPEGMMIFSNADGTVCVNSRSGSIAWSNANLSRCTTNKVSEGILYSVCPSYKNVHYRGEMDDLMMIAADLYNGTILQYYGKYVLDVYPNGSTTFVTEGYALKPIRHDWSRLLPLPLTGAPPPIDPIFVDAASSSNLQSIAASFSQHMEAVTLVSKTLGITYTREPVMCPVAARAGNISEFLSSVYGEIMSMNGIYQYLYLSYQLPDEIHWGECGCWYQDGQPVRCYFTNETGFQYYFYGVNPKDLVSEPTPNSTVENADYTKTIMKMTDRDRTNGIWHAPYLWEEAGIATFPLISYSMPLRFDASNRCVLAISIDINLPKATSLLSDREDDSEILWIDARNSILLGSSFKKSLPWLRTLMDIPDYRMSDLALTTMCAMSWANYAPLGMTPVSFAFEGMIYNTQPVFGGIMSLYQRTPLIHSTRPVKSALQAKTTSFNKALRFLMKSYEKDSAAPATYDNIKSNMNTTNFLQAVVGLQEALGEEVMFAYLSYQQANGKWADCGCYFNPPDPVSCYYVNQTGWEKDIWLGFFNTPKGELMWSDVDNMTYINIIKGMTPADAAGHWSEPYTSSYGELETYSIPMAWGTDGKCVTAMSIDVRARSLRDTIMSTRIAQYSLVSLIDVRGGAAKLVASTQNVPVGKDVFLAQITPSLGINSLTAALSTLLEGDFTTSITVPMGPWLLGALPVEGSHWVLLTQTPTSLSNYLAVEDITESLANDAFASTSVHISSHLSFFAKTTQTLGNVYRHSGKTCYEEAQQKINSNYLREVVSMQETYRESVIYMYLSYQIPGTTMWGDCGCQYNISNNGIVQCYYTDAAGTSHSFYGADWDKEVRPPQPNDSTESYEYTQIIANMTKQDTAGVWHVPGLWNVGTGMWQVITYSFPIEFNANGKCISAISFDVNASFFADVMFPQKYEGGEALLVDSRGNLTFVASSDQQAWHDVYPVLKTPSDRINDFAAVALNNLDKYRFVQDGMYYRRTTVANVYHLFYREAILQPTMPATFGLAAYFSDMLSASMALGTVFVRGGIQCYEAAKNSTDMDFLHMTASMQEAYGSRMVYAYLSYKLPGSDMWGDCGCYYADGKVGECYYLNETGWQHHFMGDDFHIPTRPPIYGMNTESWDYTKTIMNMTRADGYGVWHRPDIWTDAVHQRSFPLITFSLPLTYDAQGKCTAAISIDLSMDFVGDYLGKFGDAKTSLYYIDRRGVNDTTPGSYIGGSRVNFPGASKVYPPTNTPNEHVNDVMSYFYNMSMKNFYTTLDFGRNGTVYSMQKFNRDWTVLSTVSPKPEPTIPTTTTQTTATPATTTQVTGTQATGTQVTGSVQPTGTQVTGSVQPTGTQVTGVG